VPHPRGAAQANFRRSSSPPLANRRGREKGVESVYGHFAPGAIYLSAEAATQREPAPLLIAWNTFVRLGIFIAVALLVGRIHGLSLAF
jgi:hypothetical protein